jgi:hypothetical protein
MVAKGEILPQRDPSEKIIKITYLDQNTRMTTVAMANGRYWTVYTEEYDPGDRYHLGKGWVVTKCVNFVDPD